MPFAAEREVMNVAGAPLVVVVTPVYNGAEFLAEAMDSVQQQTYPNLAHIVLDNASTDATAEILARYGSARVPVVVKRNAETVSLGANWNAAVALVPTGAKYFRVLCADDVMAPEFVARTVALAEKHPSVAVVGCRLHHRGQTSDSAGWEVNRETFCGREAIQRLFLGRGGIIAHQTMIRCSELARRTPFFDANMAAGDTDACLDMLHHGDWGYVHETLATTRDHADTYTNTFVKGLKLDTCEYLVLLERHAEFAFGQDEGAALTRKYRRYYLRQLLRWRTEEGSAIYDKHIATMRKFGERPLFRQFLDAIMDWPLARAGLRPTWSGYPFHWADDRVVHP